MSISETLYYYPLTVYLIFCLKYNFDVSFESGISQVIDRSNPLIRYSFVSWKYEENMLTFLMKVVSIFMWV